MNENKLSPEQQAIKREVNTVSLNEVPQTTMMEAPSPEEPSFETSFTEEAPSDQPIFGEIEKKSIKEEDITERIHEITETIVNEKWDNLMAQLGNIQLWKDRVNNNIIAIKQEIVRINERFNNLEKAVLGKVSEYGEGITTIHTEMKALEKVFEKILEPLSSNIKQLDEITKTLTKLKQK